MQYNDGELIGLLTKHKKAPLIAPILSAELGWEVVLTEGYNTDLLGTFSGEIERTLSPLECATQKARKAASLLGCDLGLGSEGSFGDGPYGPIVPWHTEILVCLSTKHHWRVSGFAQGPSCHQHRLCTEVEEAKHFFDHRPTGQGLMVYPEEGAQLAVYKGLCTQTEFDNAVNASFEKSVSKKIMVGYDLRAHMCPQRQDMLVEAANDLAMRLKLRCSQCETPGFYPDKIDAGLPCRWCNSPTTQILQRTATCQRCEYQQTIKVDEKVADPKYCPVCNP